MRKGEHRMALPMRDGYLSVYSTLAQVLRTPEGEALISGALAYANEEMHLPIHKGMLTFCKSFTVEKLFSLAGEKLPQELLPLLNALLLQIPIHLGTAQTEKQYAENGTGYSVYDRISCILQNEKAANIVLASLSSFAASKGVSVREAMLKPLGGVSVHCLLTALADVLPVGTESEVHRFLQEIPK